MAKSRNSLAVASNAVVIGFNVRPDNNAKQMAQTEQVKLETTKKKEENR